LTGLQPRTCEAASCESDYVAAVTAGVDKMATAPRSLKVDIASLRLSMR